MLLFRFTFPFKGAKIHWWQSMSYRLLPAVDNLAKRVIAKLWSKKFSCKKKMDWSVINRIADTEQKQGFFNADNFKLCHEISIKTPISWDEMLCKKNLQSLTDLFLVHFSNDMWYTCPNRSLAGQLKEVFWMESRTVTYH